jgi:hypothetical protein
MNLHDSEDIIRRLLEQLSDLRNEQGSEPPAGSAPMFSVGEEVMVRGETRSDHDTDSATVIHLFYADEELLESGIPGWYYLTDHQPVYSLAWRENSLRKKPKQQSIPNTVADCAIVEKVKNKVT